MTCFLRRCERRRWPSEEFRATAVAGRRHRRRGGISSVQSGENHPPSATVAGRRWVFLPTAVILSLGGHRHRRHRRSQRRGVET